MHCDRDVAPGDSVVNPFEQVDATVDPAVAKRPGGARTGRFVTVAQYEPAGHSTQAETDVCPVNL